MARNVDKSSSSRANQRKKNTGSPSSKKKRSGPESPSSKTRPKIGRKVSASAPKRVVKPRLVPRFPEAVPVPLSMEQALLDQKFSDDQPLGHSATNLRLIERRRHPRFLLSGEQFRDVKNRKIFSVYDLSQTGLSVKVDEILWQEGNVITGVLNLHPESIEVAARVLGYYGDRAALRFEGMSTYGRGVLSKCLSPNRLGKTLMPVRENLKVSDLWFHGACSTDVFLRLDDEGELLSIEVFFSNFFCGWYAGKPKPAQTDTVEITEDGFLTTGLIQSAGADRILSAGAELGPVSLEQLNLAMDPKVDPSKVDFAHALIMASTMDLKTKQNLLRRLLRNF